MAAGKGEGGRVGGRVCEKANVPLGREVAKNIMRSAKYSARVGNVSEGSGILSDGELLA